LFLPLIKSVAGSGAARTVLERAYGRRGHSITVSHPLAPGIEIGYSDLRVITDDVADARVYYDQDAKEDNHERKT